MHKGTGPVRISTIVLNTNFNLFYLTQYHNKSRIYSNSDSIAISLALVRALITFYQFPTAVSRTSDVRNIVDATVYLFIFPLRLNSQVSGMMVCIYTYHLYIGGNKSHITNLPPALFLQNAFLDMLSLISK